LNVASLYVVFYTAASSWSKIRTQNQGAVLAFLISGRVKREGDKKPAQEL